jgi:hypothetical protein
MPHELTSTNKAKRVETMQTLLQALRSDSEKHFVHIMTGDGNWFYYSSESPTMFEQGRDEVIPRVSHTIGSKKMMIIIF